MRPVWRLLVLLRTAASFNKPQFDNFFSVELNSLSCEKLKQINNKKSLDKMLRPLFIEAAVEASLEADTLNSCNFQPATVSRIF